MGIFDIFRRERDHPYIDGYKEEAEAIMAWRDDCTCSKYLPKGYRYMWDTPEIKAAVEKIAEIISTMTIYQMKNTPNGDVRLKDGLSTFIDIEPNRKMNRQLLFSWIVQEMLLHGNAIVIPHTRKGYLYDLEPIAYGQYTFHSDYQRYMRNKDYEIHINGESKIYKPKDVLHFRFNPKMNEPWMGESQAIILRDLIANLGQSQKTIHDFLENQIFPNVVIKVSAMTDNMKSAEGRNEIEKRFIERSRSGQPWIVPDLMDVEQIRPLTLNDIAINERLDIDKRAVAAIIGIPAFMLGVGDFNKDEYNNFIRTKISVICKAIEQELTRKLLVDPDRYFVFNRKSILSYDIDVLAEMYVDLFEHGVVTGNEVRDALGMSPLDGLDELLILENYIPVAKSGEQKKLGGEDDETTV